MEIKTTMTEEEFWKKINTPVELTEAEIAEMSKEPNLEKLAEEIAEDGMGYINYAENHLNVIKMEKEKLLEVDGIEWNKKNEPLDTPTFFSTQRD